MNTRILKMAVGAIAFAAAVGSSGIASAGVASAGVASTAIGNVAVIDDQITESDTALDLIHYRYYYHTHPTYNRRPYVPPRRHYRTYERRGYYEGCRRVKKRFKDEYGAYYYRWVRDCY